MQQFIKNNKKELKMIYKYDLGILNRLLLLSRSEQRPSTRVVRAMAPTLKRCRRPPLSW